MLKPADGMLKRIWRAASPVSSFKATASNRGKHDWTEGAVAVDWSSCALGDGLLAADAFNREIGETRESRKGPERDQTGRSQDDCPVVPTLDPFRRRESVAWFAFR